MLWKSPHPPSSRTLSAAPAVAADLDAAAAADVPGASNSHWFTPPGLLVAPNLLACAPAAVAVGLTAAVAVDMLPHSQCMLYTIGV